MMSLRCVCMVACSVPPPGPARRGAVGGDGSHQQVVTALYGNEDQFLVLKYLSECLLYFGSVVGGTPRYGSLRCRQGSGTLPGEIHMGDALFPA